MITLPPTCRSSLPPALAEMVASAYYAAREAKRTRSPGELNKRIADQAPVLPFGAALERSFGLIAEIKERSPSLGRMSKDSVEQAPNLYKRSAAVKAISVLTNLRFFGDGMTVDRLSRIKQVTGKPVLRKDFIVDLYQIYE